MFSSLVINTFAPILNGTSLEKLNIFSSALANKLNNICLLIIFLALFSCSDTEKTNRQKININRNWKYLQGDHPGAEAFDYNDEKWNYVNIPHCFSTPYFQTGFWYSGYGWYRKYFEVPEKWKGKQLFIEFEGAFRDAEVFVNGKLAATHQSGYTGFSVDISDLVTVGKNVLAVRLNNLWNSQLAPRGGDYIFPGGIYRDVYLIVLNPVHVTWYGTFVTTPVVSVEKAIVNIKTEVKNASGNKKNIKLITTIFDPDNKKVDSFSNCVEIGNGVSITFDQTGNEIPNPKLWHPNHPYLYKAISEIYDGTDLLDRYETTFGIRWIEWSVNKGFFLNGEHYYFKGANVHQDHAGWAIAVTNSALIRDAKMVKEAGMDFIRGSHYPHDPSFSDACDSLGILFLQENNFWSSGIRGEGGWYTGDGAYPPHKEDQAPFEESVKNSLEEMIRIHRNHPSIIAWSMCNEPFFSKKEVYPQVREFLSKLTELSHQLDPSRKVVVAGVQRGDMDKTSDIAGYNGDGARLFIAPSVPNFISEYGSTIEDRPGSYTPGWGELQQEQYSWRCGQSIWCAFDYGTHIGKGKFGHMGMVDYYRLPKRRWYWYRNEYRHIPPPEWPTEGTPVAVHISADKRVISNTNGTDDVHLIVTVLDKEGKTISTCPDINMSVESGPGRFPTGKRITFSANSDIVIRDGKAAIEFHSYYGGKTVIKASSEGLEEATIIITTKGTPIYVEGKSVEPSDQPYQPYQLTEFDLKNEKRLNLAYLKPTTASSEVSGFSARMANDKDIKTSWQAVPGKGDNWWQVDLEAIRSVNKVNIYFPKEENYRYYISISNNGTTWKLFADQKDNELTYKMKSFQINNGLKGRFLRIAFTGSSSVKTGVSEIEVYAKK